jgi:hypothetical protein
MKIYAKAQSERAAKGQGGNEFLELDITNENQASIMKARLEYIKGNVRLTDVWFGDMDAGPLEPFLDNDGSIRNTKGEKQKGESYDETITGKNFIERMEERNNHKPF